MPSFYTRKGDDGYTNTLGEGRVAKSDERIEAVGALDECTSALGMARSLVQSEGVADLITRIQRDLYALMSEVAAEPEVAHKVRTITEAHVQWLEEQTDAISEAVGVPKGFIAFGEVGLAGEVRAVSRPELRVKEAARLGFDRCLLPAGNLKNLEAPQGIELIGVRRAEEALEGLFE